MKPLGLIFDNFGLKVLALLMAWALWFMARANLTDKVFLTLPVQVIVAEGRDTWRTEPSQREVVIEVEGPSRIVTGLASESRFAAKVTFRSQREGDPTASQKFSLADVTISELAQLEGTRAISMEPSEFTVEGRRLVEDVISVPRPDVKDTAGRASVRVIEWDNSVRVRGAQSDVKLLGGEGLKTTVSDDVLLELARGIGPLGRTDTQVRLEIDANQRREYDFEMREPKELHVRLELRSIEQLKVTLPLEIRVVQSGGQAARRVRFSPGNEIGLRDVYTPGAAGEPPTLRVVLEGTPGAIAELDEARLRAYVLEDEIPADQDVYNLSVHVQGLPFGIRLQDPIKIAVEVE